MNHSRVLQVDIVWIFVLYWGKVLSIVTFTLTLDDVCWRNHGDTARLQLAAKTDVHKTSENLSSVCNNAYLFIYSLWTVGLQIK